MGALQLPTTCPSLIRMLALPGCDEAWDLFLVRYGPLIDARCRRAGLQPADAEDIRAQVCARLVKALRGLRYDPARRFRGYIQRIVDNTIRSHWRTIRRRPGWVGVGGVAGDELPEDLIRLGAELDDQIRARIDGMLAAIDRVRFEVGPAAWQAFSLTAVDGLSGAEAAGRLGKSVASVFMAKSRVLARLRSEAGMGDG